MRLVGSRAVAAGETVQRRPLRRAPGRAARLPRRASVRRARRCGARAVPRREPVQRRPPDAGRRRDGGRGAVAAWLAEGILVARRRARLLVARAGVRRARTASRGRARGSCARSAPSRTRRGRRPAARADARGPEGRTASAAARAARAVEPIFLLYDGRLERPGGEPDLEVELEGVAQPALAARRAMPRRALADAQLLIADGHHRYETALAFHAEEGTEESAWLLASSSRPSRRV